MLTLVGTPIGNLDDLSPRACEALLAADVILAEDTRSVQRLLERAKGFLDKLEMTQGEIHPAENDTPRSKASRYLSSRPPATPKGPLWVAGMEGSLRPRSNMMFERGVGMTMYGAYLVMV